ncbi:MAG: cellulase family glycosylhydrolase [Deltaproteobacteria bacterium]|nr:cellulase family glycosylhydrolase [Deltaproteobacteria bacterium]
MKKLAIILITAFSVACNSSDVKDAIDLIEGVPRKDIDRSIVGVNAFVNDARFGSIDGQFNEIRDTLGIHFVRILFAWNDAVQPGPGSTPNFSFYDDIAASLPPGVDAIVVLTGVPGWMGDPANWIGGDPRATFVSRWVEPVVSRYASNGRIIGYQIWNEPNMAANPDNITLGLAAGPQSYTAMLKAAFNSVRQIAPSKLVLSAATTAINQNFPDTLSYNRIMVDSGALDALDVFAIHYYGKQYENVIQDGGVQDFLNGLNKEIWVTESGEQGVNNQLAYAEEVWPFLTERVSAIKRIYYYQFAEATPADVTYGLRNLTPGLSVSDLYVHLRDGGP